MNNKFPAYLKRDGAVSVTGDFDFGDRKIKKVGNGSDSTDLVNKGYIDTEMASKPNINQVILRNGSQNMTANLTMGLKRIVNLHPANGDRDAVNYNQLKEVRNSLGNYIKKSGGQNTMNQVLNMDNNKIENVKNATHNQDAVTLKKVNDGIAIVSTQNTEYTDRKIATSIFAPY